MSICLDTERKLCTAASNDKKVAPGPADPARPAFLDWGEQVVGSAHAMRVPLPAFAATPWMVTARMSAGSDAFSAEPYVAGAPETYALTDPVVVRFQPRAPGAFVGTLVIVAHHTGGRTETHQVVLRGRARAIDALPEKTPTATEPIPATTPADPSSDAARTLMTARFMRAADDARAEISRLGDGLKTGVDDVEKEAVTYRKRPERPSLWEALAKEALLLAVDVVVPKIATTLVDNLAGAIARTHHLPARQLLVHADDYVLMQQHLGERRAVQMTSWGETVSAAAPDVKSSELVKGLGKGLGTRLKTIAKGAINAGIAEQKGASTDPVIQFFSSQKGGVIKMIYDTSLLLNEQEYALAPVQDTNLDLAVAAMGAFKAAYDAAADVAQDTQARTTSQAWCAFKARDRLGVDEVGDGREVTDMTAARAWTDHGLVPPRLHDGVLELSVRMSNGTPELTGARLRGVSVHVAKRLGALDLSTANLPIRIEIDNVAFITRDEAGRLRASGAMQLIDDEAAFNTEPQAIRGAERIVRAVLAKPLDKQHVHIETDDANDTTASRREDP